MNIKWSISDKQISLIWSEKHKRCIQFNFLQISNKSVYAPLNRAMKGFHSIVAFRLFIAYIDGWDVKECAFFRVLQITLLAFLRNWYAKELLWIEFKETQHSSLYLPLIIFNEDYYLCVRKSVTMFTYANWCVYRVYFSWVVLNLISRKNQLPS